MRILQLTPRVAWPPTDGGRIVMLQAARALEGAGAHVEILSLNPRKQHVNVEEAGRAVAPIPLDAVDIDTSAHLAALLRSIPLRVPQLVARFYSPAFDAALRKKLARDDWDIVQVESPFLLPYVRTIREHSRAAVVLRSLNVEHQIWERLAAHATSFPRRMLLRRIAATLKQYEIAHLEACDALVPITELDAQAFRSLGATVPMHVLPGGIDREDPARVPTQELPGSAGFLGSLDYRPNQEAALWIAGELQPRVQATTRLHIAGSNAPGWLRGRLEDSGVAFAGQVEDARAFVESMSVMLAPLFSGGGMRIKILDAMAAGKPVVSTTIGAEGIDVTPGRDILIADDAATFAAHIATLLADPERRRTIGAAARSLVESRHSSAALARALLPFYEALARERMS